MEPVSEQTVLELLNTIRPWFDREQSFICEMARTDYGSRLALAAALIESGRTKEGTLLLQSVAMAEKTEDQEQEAARVRASMELAYILMDEMKYDEAENLLWQARNEYKEVEGLDFFREEISLLIAQCRFGQGFILESIDRTEEIIHKLKSINADKELLAKAYQNLGWFYSHKADAPLALANLRQAMELAPSLDRELVDAGMEAEKNNDFEKAVEYYFDAIRYEN